MAAQLGPLWWAAHHRHHHEHSDSPRDIHSPVRKGFWGSHIGWLLCKKGREPDYERVGDLARYPELRFLDRFHVAPPLFLMGILYGLGHGLHTRFPHLHTSGW